MTVKYILSFLVVLPLSAQWADLSSATQLNSVAPATCIGSGNPAGYCTGNLTAYQFASNAHNVIDAWGGAAADTVHNKVYIWGGGHVDYEGNEVYVLDPVAGTMTRLNNPSAPLNASGEANSDVTPVSRHTAGGLVYLPNEGSLFAWGYGVGPTPLPASNTWLYNPSNNTWTEKAALPDIGDDTGETCVLDPTQTTESVLCIDFNTYSTYRYTPSANTWVQVSASGTNGTLIVPSAECAVHPFQQVMICAGANPGFGPAAGIYSISLASGSNYAATNITSKTSGCGALYATQAPGFAWDSSTGLFVGYAGTGNSVTLFDVVSGICTTKTFSGGPSATSSINGVWGRFAYFPALNEFVVVNNAAADAFTLTLHPASLGHSAITSSGPCLDVDGDGYGVGTGCRGPDADDSDPTVQTPAQVIAKYGSMQAFLGHIGYQNVSSPSTVWCVDAVNGNDSTGAANANADTACSHAYKTWSATAATSPYIIIFRQGTYTQQINNPYGGTSSAQNIFMSYPGEQATLDYSGSSGTAIYFLGVSYITVDGLKIKGNPSGTGYLSGTYLLYPSTGPITAIGNVLRHCEISGAGNDSNIDGNNNINLAIEENVLHDPTVSGGQHNLYLGNNTSTPSTGIAIRRNILYSDMTSGGFPNLQFNGLCNACYFEQNLLYNANQIQMSFENGIQNSFIRENLVFNTGTGSLNPESMVISNYDSGQCKQAGLPSICSWDQTNNIIENNTFWAGTQGVDGSGTVPNSYTVKIANSTTSSASCGAGGSPPCGNLGGNFWRNNIIVDLSGNGSDTPVYYDPGNATNYLALDTWSNNIIQNSSAYSTYVATAGGTALTCATMNSSALSGSGCSSSSPSFNAVNTSFYSSPSSFNFSLATGSAAIGAGTPAGTPGIDIWGNALARPPSIGAINLAGQTLPLSCDLNGDGVVNSADVTIAVNQTLGITLCTTADLTETGQCTVVDVQRVVNASLGQPCLIGP